MSDSILITWKDGKRWNIHRSILKTIFNDKLPIPEHWFSSREKDVLISLARMEKEGIQIDNNIDAKFR
jgi:hypothetical protein